MNRIARKRISRVPHAWLAVGVLCAWLTACVTPPPAELGAPGEPAPSTEVAEKAERDGEFVLAAREYERLAQTAQGAKRQNLMMNAVEALLKAGQWREARQKLEGVSVAGLDVSVAARKQLLEARLLMLQGEHEKAARLLTSTLAIRQISPALTAELYGTRAQTELALNNPFGAVRNLIAREQYISGQEAIAANQLQLWKILETQKRPVLASELNIARDNVLAGWLELALAAADNTYNPAGLSAAIESWKKTYPKHPATDSLLSTLVSKAPRLTSRFERVALLLPLTSNYTVAAEAVRDGFLAMHTANHDPDKPAVKVYDTGNDSQQAPAVYEQAIREGAQIVIGPLGREATDAIIHKGALAAPTLMLSHTEENIAGAGSYVFQFGLPPEQEARQVAERAYLDGHRYAAVLYPKDPWGERMQAAFIAHWQRLGGVVLAGEGYENPKGDYSESIKKLLNIAQSEQRKEGLQARLKQKLQFEPRPRQDIDFIFLAADPKRGRLIKPQLNFYHAARVPVYATSHIFSGKGDPVQDVDLDGVLFADMPWMLVNDGRLRLLRETLQRNWPHAQSDLDRLYALGVDSYAILPHLGRISTDPSARFTGVTSALSLDRQGRLQRSLIWAQFKKGVPKLVDGQARPRGQFEVESTSGG
jgi:outer membrane PBP1 activator LpoA protein